MPDEIDHDAVVDRAEAGNAVPAAADREVQLVLAREVDGGGHVGGLGAPHDGGRPAVDHRVEDLPRVLVLLIARRDQIAAQSLAQRFDCLHAHDAPFSIGASPILTCRRPSVQSRLVGRSEVRSRRADSNRGPLHYE